MLIVKLNPGLANQMYEYAAAYALARELGQELVLDISECVNSSRGYLLDYFRIPDARKLVYSQVSTEAGLHLNCDSAFELLGDNLLILVGDMAIKDKYASELRVLPYIGFNMAKLLRPFENLYMRGYFFSRNRYYEKYWDEIRPFFVQP